MGDGDDRRRILSYLRERRYPFRDRHYHRLEHADLPAIVLGFGLDGVSDHHAVVLRSGYYRDLVVGPFPGALLDEIVEEHEQPRPVVIFGWIAHEDTEIFFWIAFDLRIMRDVGVVVDVEHAGVGNDIVFSAHRAG